ncbi:MAG: hypothetical protein SGJ19_29460 [Planctomycetia bacterium]|nr:hypothetical protein [Planctomycetia bacterium]
MSDVASPAPTPQRRISWGIIAGVAVVVLVAAVGWWFLQNRARDAAETEARAALNQVADRILLVANGPHVEVVNMLQPIERELFPQIGKLHHLHTCKLSDCGIVDEQLAELTSLPHLLVLQVERCPGVTSQGMAHVGQLTTLEKLFADGTSVDDAGLAELQGLDRLTTLDLSNTKITDQGLAQLAGLSSLEVLRVAGTPITDAGLEPLKTMTTLHLLNISNTQVTAEGKRALLAANKALKLEETEPTDDGETKVE